MTKKQFQHKYSNEFFEILENKNVSTYFQPIISLINGETIGYEALTRGPVDSPLYFPDRLFDCAKKYNKVWELDLLCRIKAIEGANDIIGDKYLFINIDPHIIKDPDFKRGFTREYLRKYNISPQNIIFEITEHTAISDYNSFKEIIGNYRTQGYRIAIDDTGDGYSGLRMLSEIRPNFIKIDMELVRNIDKDMLKRELIKCIQKFAEATNIKIIAEGIETYDELKALIDIGIEYGQGYYIQRPNPSFIKINEEITDTIRSIRQLKDLAEEGSTTIKIGNYCRLDTPLDSCDIASKARDIFNQNPNINGIPVVKNKSVVGLIMREKFERQSLLSKDNWLQQLKEPIKAVMDSDPLMVDSGELLANACRRALSRDEDRVYDYIIVIEQGKYKGVVPFGVLLDSLLTINGF